MRHLALALFFAAACGSSDTKTPDAGLTCSAYCTSVMAACTTTNQQYASMDQCVASCAHYPEGASGDMSGNTLGCRTTHANLAKTDPTTHCVHAGPSGGGVCGTPCEGFCSLVTAECPTAWTTASCPTGCAAFAATPPYTSNITSGNSLSCRIYHATEASTDATDHCAHTTASSTPCM
jgi:hypothetical protein